MHSGVSQMN